MTAPLLPSPPSLPFRQRFIDASSSPPSLPPSPLSQTSWPGQADDSIDSPSRPPSSRASTSPKPTQWAIQTQSERYVAALEQRHTALRTKPQTPLRPQRAVSPSRLAPLTLSDSSDTDDDDEDEEPSPPSSNDTRRRQRVPSDTEEESGEEGDDDDDDQSDAEEPLLLHNSRRGSKRSSSLHSRGTSRTRSLSPSRARPAEGGLTAAALASAATSGRIAFAPIVRIGAGIRSLASSYTHPSAFPPTASASISRSSSPASSIYAPLLPGPGPAPGTALRQAALQARNYGTTTNAHSPVAQLQRQAVEHGGVPGGSPYKKLLEAQKRAKRARRRRKRWRAWRDGVLAWLCWPFAMCRRRRSEEDVERG